MQRSVKDVCNKCETSARCETGWKCVSKSRDFHCLICFFDLCFHVMSGVYSIWSYASTSKRTHTGESHPNVLLVAHALRFQSPAFSSRLFLLSEMQHLSLFLPSHAGSMLLCRFVDVGRLARMAPSCVRERSPGRWSDSEKVLKADLGIDVDSPAVTRSNEPADRPVRGGWMELGT